MSLQFCGEFFLSPQAAFTHLLHTLVTCNYEGQSIFIGLRNTDRSIHIYISSTLIVSSGIINKYKGNARSLTLQEQMTDFNT